MSTNVHAYLVELHDYVRTVNLETGAGDLNGAHVHMHDPNFPWPDIEHRIISNLCKTLYGGYAKDTFADDWPPIQRTRPIPSSVASPMIIPVPSNAELRFMTDILKRTTLYSTLTVLVHPGSVRYRLRATPDGYYFWRGQQSSLFDTLQWNSRYPDLVKSGRGVFLPQEYILEVYDWRDGTENIYDAPLIQTPDCIRYTPANVSIGQRTRNAYSDMMLYKTVVLPYFPHATLDTVTNIAVNETDSFVRFTHYLSKRLTSMADASDPETIADIMDEIDYSVAGLRIEAEKLTHSRALQQVQVGFFALGLAIALTVPNAPIKTIAGVAGSVNLLGIIKEYIDSRRAKLALKQSDFYIPYLLSKVTAD